MSITRRQLLLSGVALGVGGNVYLVIGGCSPSEELGRIDVSAVLLQPKRVLPIGREFRAQFPAEVDSRALEHRVFDALPGQRAVSVEVNQRLAELIREDFSAERVFLFQGWVLSHVEGQLSALAVREWIEG